ncbi:MAG: hypothetical protein ABIO55_12475 [Ginsengibacter sp.]
MRGVIAIFMALGFVIFFSSCQKEFNPDADTRPVSVRVKTYTEDITSSFYGNSVITYNLSYDANNRIISLTSAASPGDKFIYQYNGNSSYTLDIYNSNLISIQESFFINSSLMVDSTLQHNGTDTTTEKYIYNSLKQLLKRKIYDYSTVTGALLFDTDYYNYDTNGNVISDSNNSGITTYTFYNNLINSAMIGQFYFYQNKNLIKTTTYTSGGVTAIAKHTYTFDSKNRISSERITSDNGDILIKTYTYY